jgi:hypothetical protein
MSPSSGFTGKILSTSRLYLGRNAEQPQQPLKYIIGIVIDYQIVASLKNL